MMEKEFTTIDPELLNSNEDLKNFLDKQGFEINQESDFETIISWNNIDTN